MNIMDLEGKLYGDDANGTIYNRETGKFYEILPATFEKFKELRGMKKADAIVEFAKSVLVDGVIVNNDFFAEIDTEPFPTKEKLKEIYLEYNGDEYMLWRDFGDAYRQACRKFDFSPTDIKKKVAY